jgi:hypothetical protein
MLKSLISFSNNRSSAFLLVLALIVAGVGAQATGLLNTKSGGYLVCVNSKTKVVTHPGTSKCPKGSKKLILGAQGAAGVNGLTGAAGLSGRDGIDGVNGKTLWNGTIDPLDQWGAAGDFYINYVSKNLFGPKSYNQSWPAGVSLVGPKGDQGLIGLTGAKGDQGPIGLTGATGAQGPSGGSGGSGAAGAAGAAGATGATGATGVAAPVVTDPTNCIGTKCTYKVGDVGPGGGLIFFVDYFGQYEDFNYLEAAPVDLPGTYAWSNNTTTSVMGGGEWLARAVGRGQANTTAIITAYPISGAAVAADAYSSPSYNSVVKSDWFLGSLGEVNLMYNNLQGLGGLVAGLYWSSSEINGSNACGMYFDRDSATYSGKSGSYFVRPVRAF